MSIAKHVVMARFVKMDFVPVVNLYFKVVRPVLMVFALILLSVLRLLLFKKGNVVCVMDKWSVVFVKINLF